MAYAQLRFEKGEGEKNNLLCNECINFCSSFWLGQNERDGEGKG